MTEDWRQVNLANWESRVPVHTGPDGYDIASFDDPTHLSNVVRYDLPRLGRLDDLDVVHLQCHIGTDTVSLARLGARTARGLDFSPAAVSAARELAQRAGSDAQFHVADVYDAVTVLGAASCDLVYTGIGALCWLPDARRWAEVIAGLLRPGGRFFMRETHPVLESVCDPRPDGLLVLEFPYFETAGTRFVTEDSYAGNGALSSPEEIVFNHGLGKVFTALTAAGLEVTMLEEHREVPWKALGEAMVPSPEFDGEYILAADPERLPLTYTVQALLRS